MEINRLNWIKKRKRIRFKGNNVINLGDTYTSTYIDEDGTSITFKFHPFKYVAQTGGTIFWAYSPHEKRFERIFQKIKKRVNWIMQFEPVATCSMLLVEKVIEIKPSDIYR